MSFGDTVQPTTITTEAELSFFNLHECHLDSVRPGISLGKLAASCAS